MLDSFASFFGDYEKAERIITEYLTSFQFGLSQRDLATRSDNGQLLQQLQIIENQEREKKLVLQHQIQDKINSLREILRTVDDMERSMDEPRYHRFKHTNWSRDQHTNVNQHRSRQEINAQVDETIKSIEKITHSKMPKTIAAICGFFNPSFRHDAYRQIAEKRDRLEQMIVNAEYDIHAASAQLQAEIAQATMTQLAALQAQKTQMDAQRAASNNHYFTELKKLLLNGLEEVFCGDSIYGRAHSSFEFYTAEYLAPSEGHDPLDECFLLGISPQRINVSDDGTLDHFLTTILKDGLYANGSILLPIGLKRYYPRPICVTYQSNLNSGIYPLFANYAIQLLNLHKDVGISVYLVDCSNLGAKYSEFTSIDGNDEDKRVNIIRTAEELESVLDSLSEYIIESNTRYLRNEYSSIEEYNRNSSTKREIRLLFISNITELHSNENLSTLQTILRNGDRCGVHTFVAISNDEYQVSGVISQSRVTLISSLMEQCDRFCMSSDGSLSFGNGLPQLIAPPQIQQSIVTTILNEAVSSSRTPSIIPFADQTILEEEFFSYKCDKAIDIPIGLDQQGNEYVIHLNKDAAYMLVGGNPSCGKSSLLHTIILQCITRYSPDDLELYLADLKDGSEFDTYAQRGIKSIKAILNDAESDIASSFLQFIKSSVEMRLEQFSQIETASGKLVRNIEQFYEVNNEGHYSPHIPRMLLIIDEFQSLYNSSRETGEITNWLVRMCRTVGIYIIMASQRVQADSSAVANSFGHQTKEYFIYRGVMKLPFSGAREIMSEHCSDTNRENPAIRKAQILKTGQIIINPNMGATEEDNTLVQCYYPSNEIISSICECIVHSQGMHSGTILNSEKAVSTNILSCSNTSGIIIGESNRLFYDVCNPNTDVFRDNYSVSIDHSIVHRLIVLGNDKRVSASIITSCIYEVAQERPNDFILNVLAKPDEVSSIFPIDLLPFSLAVSTDVSTFLQNAHDALTDGHYLFNVIVSPYNYEGLAQDAFSDPPEEVVQLQQLWNKQGTFTIIVSDQISRIKDNCAYCDSDIPYRIISVGNLASIRAAMTLDAAEKINESPYNTIRPSVIKAYYYNKQTDKCGRCRLFNPTDVLRLIPKQETHDAQNHDDTGYAGLTGN